MVKTWYTRAFVIAAILTTLNLFALMGVASAHTQNAFVPLTTCTYDGCEGKAPPPAGPSNCKNDADRSIKTIYDNLGHAIGQLNLFESDEPSTSCFTFWAGLKNTSIYTYTITNEKTIEAGSDNSATGALDSIPHTITPGTWESTKMVNWGGTGIGVCYHSTDTVTDELGDTGIVTNTDTICN